jgi:hypothetical protein
MRPQPVYLTCIHSAHVYHLLAAVPLENDGEFIGFTGNRMPTRVPIPIKLPLLAMFEWKQVNAVDNPNDLDKQIQKSTTGATMDARCKQAQDTVYCTKTSCPTNYRI